jgi:hypothetical protein
MSITSSWHGFVLAHNHSTTRLHEALVDIDSTSSNFGCSKFDEKFKSVLICVIIAVPGLFDSWHAVGAALAVH